MVTSKITRVRKRRSEVVITETRDVSGRDDRTTSYTNGATEGLGVGRPLSLP